MRGRCLMRVFQLIPILLFSLTTFTQLSLSILPSQLYAWTCCGCNCSGFGCCCPGKCGCAKYACRSNKDNDFETFTKIVRASEPTTTEVQVRPIGECARRSWGLRVLGEAAASLRLQTASFGSGAQSNTLSVAETVARPQG
jgi:hypothetical protein